MLIFQAFSHPIRLKFKLFPHFNFFKLERWSRKLPVLYNSLFCFLVLAFFFCDSRIEYSLRFSNSCPILLQPKNLINFIFIKRLYFLNSLIFEKYLIKKATFAKHRYSVNGSSFDAVFLFFHYKFFHGNVIFNKEFLTSNYFL